MEATIRAICDRCGFEYDHGQLRKEWTGFMVCRGPATNDCWEPRHPQEFVRAVRDNQGVRPNMRPEPADVFIDTLPPLRAYDGSILTAYNGSSMLSRMPW